jgi:hypothetical protein
MVLILLAVAIACAKAVEDERVSAADSPVAIGQQTSDTTDPIYAASDSIKSDYPYSTRWIPGQRDTEDFDVLSKLRAHANRLSKDVLVLTLETPAIGLEQKRRSEYLVADSAVITGLSPGELFRNDCNMRSGRRDGLVTGIPSTNIWERSQHPRLAWEFDTVSMKIRSIPGDSVSCILSDVDE